jgi:uncharacterized protein (TIGR02145 family)/prepilin-type N-terminal cleavage/methylation domain-containing protein
MKKIIKNKKKGAFSLMELIIAISVIALLSALIVFSFYTIRKDSRDSKRILDISKIQLALEEFYLLEGHYPEFLTAGEGLIGPSTGIIFLDEFPENPSYYDFDCSHEGYLYTYNTSTGKYMISFCLEKGVEGFSDGPKCATPGGILDEDCSEIGEETTLGSSCNGETSITYHGYSYDIVEIGEQCWFAENLQTTKYNNDIDIPNITDDTAWSNDTSGAYAWYENDETAYGVYGALYNWYAVDTGGLCPAGWSVPTDGEWTNLTDYIINSTEAESAIVARWLKSCREDNSDFCTECLSGETCPTSDHPRWNYNETHYGINAYGFNVLPAGYRFDYGVFSNLGLSAYFWSSSENNPGYSWDRYLFSGFSSEVGRGAANQPYGFSVRCLRTE